MLKGKIQVQVMRRLKNCSGDQEECMCKRKEQNQFCPGTRHLKTPLETSGSARVVSESCPRCLKAEKLISGFKGSKASQTTPWDASASLRRVDNGNHWNRTMNFRQNLMNSMSGHLRRFARRLGNVKDASGSVSTTELEMMILGLSMRRSMRRHEVSQADTLQ